MIFATLTNMVTIVLCGAVLVQSLRMMRSISLFKEADLPLMVGSLQTATREAEKVLEQLHHLLTHEADPKLKVITDGHAMAEELGLMIGIANATADRLLAARREGSDGSPQCQELAA